MANPRPAIDGPQHEQLPELKSELLPPVKDKPYKSMEFATLTM
jgi:hypothetical protein